MPRTLQSYLTTLQRYLHDLNLYDFSQSELIDYINSGRMRAALDLHCCRTFFDNLSLLPQQERYPLQGGVAGLKLVTGGANYVNPLVTFSGGGGYGAAATATQAGGIITGLTLTNWGQGYTTTPAVNIIDGSGFITNYQIRQGLAALTSPAMASSLVYNAIIALPAGNATYIQWNSGAPTLPGDALFTTIQSALTFSVAQMGALYQAAANMPVAPTAVPFGAGAGQTLATQGMQTSLVSSDSVSNQQIRLALASPQYGLITALYGAISSNPADPANMVWNSGAETALFDPLSQVMNSALGMTWAQIANLYAFADTFPESSQTLTNQQVRVGIANAGAMAAVLAAIPSSPADPLNIQWNSGAGTTPHDALYNLIATVANAASIYANAATQPANAPGSGALAQAIVLRNVVDWQFVSVSFGVMKPMLERAPWSMFQAVMRMFGSIPQGWPVCFTTFPENNYAMVFRIPDQVYGMELDAVVLPDPLSNLTDVETQLLPPNDDCVCYYAAYLAYLRLQQFGPAAYYSSDDPRTPGLYQKRMKSLNATKQPIYQANVYTNIIYRLTRSY